MKLFKILLVTIFTFTVLFFLFATREAYLLSDTNEFPVILGTLSIVGLLSFTGRNKRLTVFISGAGIMLSAYLLAINNMHIMTGAKLQLPAYLIITGGGLLALFFDSKNNKSLLAASGVTLLSGFLFLTLLKDIFIFDWLNFINRYTVRSWPYIILLIGLGAILKARKIQKSEDEIIKTPPAENQEPDSVS